MIFPIEALQQHLAIVGKVGSGKTYAAKGLVEGLLEAQRRVCILDPTGAWYGLRSSADGMKPGYPVAVFGGAHGDVPIAERSGATLAHILAEKNLPAIIDLSEMLIGQRHRFVTDFAEAIYRENKSPLHLIIDEADEFIPQNPMPETRRLLHHIDRIIRRGRIKGFRVMMITQRPAVIHKNALTQANTLVVMRLTAPQDRKAIQAWIEGNADAATGKTVLSSLAGMSRGEGWVWSPEIDVLEQMKFPKIRTFDSSRSPEDDETLIEPTKLADVDLGEIKKSFEAVEQEARTLADLQAENAKLKRDLAGAERVAAKPVKHASSPDLNLHKTTVEFASRKSLEQIIAIATKELNRNGGSQPNEPVRHTPHRAKEPVATFSRPAAVNASTAGATGISGPQKRILDALAWFEAIGVEAPRRSPLAAVAGVSPKSSGFLKNLSTIKTGGFVEYPNVGRVALTIAGRQLATSPDVTPTNDELHESIYRMLSMPQATLLRVLVNCPQHELNRQDLAHAANVSPLSSGFLKNISTLKSFELVEYPSNGKVRATDLLFPEHAK